MEAVSGQVKRFIVDNILSGGSIESVTNDTNLRDTGLLDSLSVLKLVAFLEEEFGIRFEASDLDETNFLTIESIRKLIESKTSNSAPPNA